MQALTVNHFPSFFFSINPYQFHVSSNQISFLFNHSLSLALTIFNHFFIYCFTHQIIFNHFQIFTLHLCLIYTYVCQFTFSFSELCQPCTHHLSNFTNSQCKHHSLDISFHFFFPNHTFIQLESTQENFIHFQLQNNPCTPNHFYIHCINIFFFIFLPDFSVFIQLL